MSPGKEIRERAYNMDSSISEDSTRFDDIGSDVVFEIKPNNKPKEG